MKTEMNLLIEIKQPINSLELYTKLSPYGVNVTDLITKVLVHAHIDIKDEAVEKIINTCREYGECDVRAHMVKGPRE